MKTVTWFYIWFFIVIQAITLLTAYARLGTPNVPLRLRLVFSATTILRGVGCALFGWYMLPVLELELLYPIQVFIIVTVVSLADLVLKWFLEKALLKIPPPSFRDFFG